MQRNVHEKRQGRVSEFRGREKGEGVIDQVGSEQQVLVGIVEGTPLSSGDMGPALRAGIARLVFINVSAGQGKRLSLGKEVSVQALDSSSHPCISHEIQRAWFLYGGCLGADLFYFSLNDSHSRICAVNTDAHGLSPQGFLSASHTHSAMLLHFGSLLPVDCQQLDRFYVISLSVSDEGWCKGSLIPGRLCVTLD